MDIATQMRHLVVAEGHVREGERRLAQQRAIVDELDRDHHRSVTMARSILRQCEALQGMLVQHRDLVRAELQAKAGR